MRRKAKAVFKAPLFFIGIALLLFPDISSACGVDAKDEGYIDPDCGRRYGRIALVIESAVNDEFWHHIRRYKRDLWGAGFSVVENIYTSGTPESIRAYLAGLYSEQESLVGAIFIGRIPHAYWEMYSNINMNFPTEVYEYFPCDIFYMDVDGQWLDVTSDRNVRPNNGRYDARQGDIDLDIWVSRIKADNLPSLDTPSQLYLHYFNKNHYYRTGVIVPEQKALMYVDDPFEPLYGDSYTLLMEDIWGPENVTVVTDSAMTTAADFTQNQMAQGYEVIISVALGWMQNQIWFLEPPGSTFGTVYSSDLPVYDPDWYFWLIGSSYACDFTYPDYLGGSFVYNKESNSLIAIGTAETGAFTGSEYLFFDPLTSHSTFGYAFIHWFNLVQADPQESQLAPHIYYGVNMIGDASLQLWMYMFDYDEDGTPNYWESTYGCSMATTVDDTGDCDEDGLANVEEYENDTNPDDEDTEGDEMPDGWEVAGNLDPLTDDSGDDPDSDGLINLAEFNHGSDPQTADTDLDGMSDGDEVAVGRNPVVPEVPKLFRGLTNGSDDDGFGCSVSSGVGVSVNGVFVNAAVAIVLPLVGVLFLRRRFQ